MIAPINIWTSNNLWFVEMCTDPLKEIFLQIFRMTITATKRKEVYVWMRGKTNATVQPLLSSNNTCCTLCVCFSCRRAGDKDVVEARTLPTRNNPLELEEFPLVRPVRKHSGDKWIWSKRIEAKTMSVPRFTTCCWGVVVASDNVHQRYPGRRVWNCNQGTHYIHQLEVFKGVNILKNFFFR